MKTILVTGGAGFIGSEFVRQGAEDYNIIVVDSLSYAGDFKRIALVEDKIKFFNNNICNREHLENIFKEEKPDYIVHWAAETHVDRSILNPTIFIDVNIKGTQNLLDLARKYNIQKFINISTDEVYGELGEKGQFSETTPLNPNSPYSVSKAASDMLGRAYFRTYGLPVITVRPSNNYGPWQYPEKLIPVVIFKAINNEKIPVYGTGQNVREWMHISDCVRGVFEIIKKGKEGEIYNIGSNEEKSNIEVVEKILNLLNKPKTLIDFVKDRPGHDFRYSLDITKIKNKVGWKPKISFEEGIKDTIAWYLNNIEWLKSKEEEIRKFWKSVY